MGSRLKALGSREIEKLKTIIPKFSKVKILVIGDLILDEFVWGDVSRISLFHLDPDSALHYVLTVFQSPWIL